MLVKMSDKLFVPNSTQVPNFILDYLLANLPYAELKCFLYIVRRTYGFRKKYDRISFTQFQNGIKDRDDNRLDYGTGLSRPSVNSALKNLISADLVRKVSTFKGNRYMINLNVNLLITLDKISRNKRADSEYINKRFNQLKLL